MNRHGFVDCYDYDEDSNLAIGRWQGRACTTSARAGAATLATRRAGGCPTCRRTASPMTCRHARNCLAGLENGDELSDLFLHTILMESSQNA